MSKQTSSKFESVDDLDENFQFHDYFTEETNNGLIFNNNIYIPEEVLTIILSHVEPKEILSLTLVCKKWCNIIKSDLLWSLKYQKKYKKQPKRLPWYIFYCLFATNWLDQNLIQNGNGQNGFDFWKIIKNYGDAFKIEKVPAGAQPLPDNVPEFNGHSSCFATSYYECQKQQTISLKNSRLLMYILNNFKPHIYVSEWVTGRFDCGCTYSLWCKLLGKHCNDPVFVTKSLRFEQWSMPQWTKVELVLKDYSNGIDQIVFVHEGKDTQFWKGHYGSKMAGGVVKILFDSIKPLEIKDVEEVP